MVKGLCQSGGVKIATVKYGKEVFEVKGTAPDPAEPIALDGNWEFEVVPTMDNRFGDFRLPPSNGLIGAEARRFKYAEETLSAQNWSAKDFDDSGWHTATYSFGPYFQKLGPIPEKGIIERHRIQYSVFETYRQEYHYFCR